MTNIAKEDVKKVMEPRTPMSKTEIRDKFVEEHRCSECGRTKNYREVEDVTRQVSGALRRLMADGDVLSTPDWNYELVK